MAQCASNSFPDIKFQGSIISSYIAIVVVIAKKVLQTWPPLVPIAYQTTTPILVACFLGFFRFSHFLAFSVTVVRIFVQIIALLCFTGSGNAVAILH